MNQPLKVTISIACFVLLFVGANYLDNKNATLKKEAEARLQESRYQLDSNIVARIKELQIEVLEMQQVMKAHVNTTALCARNDDAMIDLVIKVVDRVNELERTTIRFDPDAKPDDATIHAFDPRPRIPIVVGTGKQITITNGVIGEVK